MHTLLAMVLTACLSSAVQASPSPLLIEPARSPPVAAEVQEQPALPTFKLRFVAAPQIRPFNVDTKTGHIYFEAVLNGRTIWVVVDNKAGVSAVDVGIAEELGLKFEGDPGRIEGIASEVANYRISEIEFILPNQFRIDGPFRAINLKPLSERAGRKIGLIIGQNVLDRLAYFVDGAQKKMTFAPSGAIKINRPDAHVIPWKEGRVEARLEGRPATLEIDLGSNVDLTLFPSSWDDYIPADIPTQEHQLIDIGGKSFSVLGAEDVKFELSSLVRNIRVRQIPIEREGHAGYIGYPFFAGRLVLFDRGAEQIVVLP